MVYRNQTASYSYTFPRFVHLCFIVTCQNNSWHLQTPNSETLWSQRVVCRSEGDMHRAVEILLVGLCPNWDSKSMDVSCSSPSCPVNHIVQLPFLEKTREPSWIVLFLSQFCKVYIYIPTLYRLRSQFLVDVWLLSLASVIFEHHLPHIWIWSRIMQPFHQTSASRRPGNGLLWNYSTIIWKPLTCSVWGIPHVWTYQSNPIHP